VNRCSAEITSVSLPLVCDGAPENGTSAPQENTILIGLIRERTGANAVASGTVHKKTALNESGRSKGLLLPGSLCTSFGPPTNHNC
jgi:hypothetical protein